MIALSSTTTVCEVTDAILTTSSPSDIPAPITLCPTSSVPETPSTVKVLEATVIAPLTVATMAEAVWKEMMSPAEIVASDLSWSSTVIDKSPTAPAPFT